MLVEIMSQLQDVIEDIRECEEIPEEKREELIAILEEAMEHLMVAKDKD